MGCPGTARQKALWADVLGWYLTQCVSCWVRFGLWLVRGWFFFWDGVLLRRVKSRAGLRRLTLRVGMTLRVTA